MPEMPPDPFEPEIPQEVYNSIDRIEDANAREGMRAFLSEIPRATEEVHALLAQGSFDDLSRAVSALDEDRLRVDVLVAAMLVIESRLTPEQWSEWMMAGRQ